MKKEDRKFLKGKGHICNYCEFYNCCVAMENTKDYDVYCSLEDLNNFETFNQMIEIYIYEKVWEVLE